MMIAVTCPVMNLRKLIFQRRVVKNDSGGLVSDGPYRVRIPILGFKMIYSEGEQKLTLPLEIGLDGSINIGMVFIRCRDDSSIPFNREQVAIIERNIFSALDRLQIRYTNVR